MCDTLRHEFLSWECLSFKQQAATYCNVEFSLLLSRFCVESSNLPNVQVAFFFRGNIEQLRERDFRDFCVDINQRLVVA